MLSDNQITTYKTEGLTKSSTCLSEDKIRELNKALEKYLEEHKTKIQNLYLGYMKEIVIF